MGARLQEVRLSAPTAPGAAFRAAREVARELGTDATRGLTGAEAVARLARYGPNRPERPRRPSYLRLAANQLLDPLVLLLVAASLVSIAVGDVAEGAAVAAVLVLNGGLGFWQEVAAERAILALSEGFAQQAAVVRDGLVRWIAAEELVPGDLLLVREGERVGADARVVDAQGLEVDESSLTGESLPVAKQAAPVPAETPLAERASMVHAGTGVTRGRGRAVVSATGGLTELGQIETLAAAAKPPPTPLARRLSRLARQMVFAGAVITVLLTGSLLVRGEPLHEAFLVGVAVAVAAVPEGLAATVTAALALGARVMARRGAIVRRLAAIETLGETTVICTDKTGTLTENRIRVAALRPAAGVDERELLSAAVLASTVQTGADGPVGDPIEQALLLAAMERGLSREEILGERRVLQELPFDAERKRMTLVYDEAGGRRAFMKGAPEVVAARAAPDDALVEAAAAWAGEGFRVLAVATRRLAGNVDEPEDGHVLAGVVALHDPLRPTAAHSIAAARAAGIEVRMLTGDHPATARTIGHALGLDDAAIVARATPADKLDLVAELQRAGHVVAVTGDGVNDAPALRRADVGVAMGGSGTEAAREAAAIVLTDDDFATIVAAVEEGRRIGDNIRKFVAFLLSANLGEVLVFAVAILAGLGVPLAVIQVLMVNLVTDGLPALALARDPASAGTMTSPPRRAERLFDRLTWLGLGAIGVLVGATTLAAFGVGRALGGDLAQTMAFATLALAELALAFAIRSPRTHAWRLPRNRWLLASAASSAALVAAVVYVPFAHGAFGTVSLGPGPALAVVALALAPFAVIELAKAVVRYPPAVVRRRDRRSSAERSTSRRERVAGLVDSVVVRVASRRSPERPRRAPGERAATKGGAHGRKAHGR
jgi:P-type Ca2+ transporter type 2C